MMGLDQLLRGLYGTVPQLDMDKQFARSRIVRPMTFDFAALVDGIKRNNVGTAGIRIEVDAEIKDGRVVFRPTGQSFPLQGTAWPGVGRRRFQVHDWLDPAKTRLSELR